MGTEVKEIMLKHAFVGIVDIPLGLSLVQQSTRLFLANHATLGYVIMTRVSSLLGDTRIYIC